MDLKCDILDFNEMYVVFIKIRAKRGSKISVHNVKYMNISLFELNYLIFNLLDTPVSVSCDNEASFYPK